jgi:hypothetical protein
MVETEDRTSKSNEVYCVEDRKQGKAISTDGAGSGYSSMQNRRLDGD